MRAPAIRRVVVGVSGTLANLAALHAAAAIARRCDVELIAVHAGDTADVLERALVDAFGGLPPGVAVTSLVVPGDAGDVLVRASADAGDVLVVGSGRPRRLRRRTSRVSRYCVSNARCLVVTVPPPPMIARLPRSVARAS